MRSLVSLCIAATVALGAGCSSVTLDADGDGFISRQEARKDDAVARVFDAADRNGDGKLDRDEFKSMPAH